MSKRKGNTSHQLTVTAPVAAAVEAELMTQRDGGSVSAFSFGDPEPVARIQLLDYVESMFNGRWYEPPLPWEGLASAFRASPHHGSAIFLKRNLLKAMFVPHPRLSSATFGAMALDFLVFGNAYVEQPRAYTGRALQLRHALAKFTRRGQEPGTYFFVRGWLQEHEFEPGSLFHLREDDVNQEIYGLDVLAELKDEDGACSGKAELREGREIRCVLVLAQKPTREEVLGRLQLRADRFIDEWQARIVADSPRFTASPRE